MSRTLPIYSIILMEGVTDEKNLLTNKISYKRMAKSLGLAEQHEKFEPTRGELVMADVDVGQFTRNTIDFLNLVIASTSAATTGFIRARATCCCTSCAWLLRPGGRSGRCGSPRCTSIPLTATDRKSWRS